MGGIEKVQNILDPLMRRIARDNCGEFRKIWKKVVSEDERGHSSAVHFKEGVLTVLVDNSAYLQDFILKRREVMDKINLISPDKKISEINFKIGTAD